MFIPEEEHALSQFLALCLSREHRFQRVGVVSSVPCLGGYSHGCRSEVLHLFEVEIQSFGDDGEFCHVFFLTPRVATNKVRYDLLVQVFLAVDAVEDTFELLKLSERGLAHESQDIVGGMLWCHLQASADVMTNQFTGILPCALIGFLVFALMEKKVIAHSAADEALLDLW